MIHPLTNDMLTTCLGDYDLMMYLSFCTEIEQAPDVELDQREMPFHNGARLLVLTWKVSLSIDKQQSVT